MYQLHNLSPTFLNMPEVEIKCLMFFCCSRMYFRIDACLSVIKVLIIRPHPRRYAIQFLNPRNSIAGLLPATFLYKNRRTHSCSSLFKQNSWGKCMSYRSNINLGYWYIFDTNWFLFPLSLFIIIWTIIYVHCEGK